MLTDLVVNLTHKIRHTYNYLKTWAIDGFM